MRKNYTLRGNPRKREFYAAHLRGLGLLVDSGPMADKTRPLDDATKAAQANLRLWRKSRNLTLGQLAEHTGNSVSSLSAWETGQRRMDMEDLVKMAAFYGVAPAALLMAPQEAGPKIQRMALASQMAAEMSDEAFAAWIAAGRMMTPKP